LLGQTSPMPWVKGLSKAEFYFTFAILLFLFLQFILLQKCSQNQIFCKLLLKKVYEIKILVQFLFIYLCETSSFAMIFMEIKQDMLNRCTLEIRIRKDVYIHVFSTSNCSTFIRQIYRWPSQSGGEKQVLYFFQPMRRGERNFSLLSANEERRDKFFSSFSQWREERQIFIFSQQMMRGERNFSLLSAN